MFNLIPSRGRGASARRRCAAMLSRSSTRGRKPAFAAVRTAAIPAANVGREQRHRAGV